MQNENSQLTGSSPDAVVRQLERIANLLALLVTHGKPQVEQIVLLSGAGYSSAEIAQLVGTTRNTVGKRCSFSDEGRPEAKEAKEREEEELGCGND